MQKLTVLVSGSSGLIGKALCQSLQKDGHRVLKLVRRNPATADEFYWRPEAGELGANKFGEGQVGGDNQGSLSELLAGADVVINLNGASIGKLPWGKKYRHELYSSRLAPTKALSAAIAKIPGAKPFFVSASAVGFYGQQQGKLVTEATTAGTTFLAKLCQEWEQATAAAQAVTGVALLRTAPILHPESVLKPIIALTKLGVGGPLGKGTQVWPWVSLTDEVRAIRHIIDKRLTGPINVCGPEPATANDIGKSVAKALQRPFLLPVPAWALRLVVSADAADSLLLTDCDAKPAALLLSGFKFEHQTAAECISAQLT